MSTAFSDLEVLMRVALGDTDVDAYCYPAEVLDGHLRLAILQVNDPNFTEDPSNPRSFLGVLSVLQQARMIYRACRSVIAGVPDHYSYRTPVLSIIRERGAAMMRSYYDQILTGLENKLSIMTSTSELDEMVQSTLRYTLAYSRALGKVPQYTNVKI